MISASEGERGHGKADVVWRLHEFCSINQFQMRTKGEGVKKSKNVADVINGCSPIPIQIPDSLLKWAQEVKRG